MPIEFDDAANGFLTTQKAQMIWSLLSLELASFMTKSQLQPEILFLRKISGNCIRYYHNQRAQLGLGKDSPLGRKVDAVGEIQSVVVANGLHHFYYRKAAQAVVSIIILLVSPSRSWKSCLCLIEKQVFFCEFPPSSHP